MHFFLVDQNGEVTLIDAGLRGHRDTLTPALSVFDRRLRNPTSPTATPHREKEPRPCPQTPSASGCATDTPDTTRVWACPDMQAPENRLAAVLGNVDRRVSDEVVALNGLAH